MIDRCKSTQAVKPNLKAPETRKLILVQSKYEWIYPIFVCTSSTRMIFIQTNISMSPCPIIESFEHFWL